MSKFFIDRPIFAIVIAIVIVIIGAVSILRLPVSQYPNIVPPTIQVTTTYPGASAETIANTVGIPMENQINGVEGSIYMQSTSGSDGTYTLTVTFAVGTNLNTALSLVQNFANAALAQLPSAVQALGVTVRKVSTNILQVVSLYSDDDRFDEAFLANYGIINLQNPIGRVRGVGQVAVVGAGSYAMRIWLDPERLESFELPDLGKASQRVDGKLVDLVVRHRRSAELARDHLGVLLLDGLHDIQNRQFERLYLVVGHATEEGVDVCHARDTDEQGTAGVGRVRLDPHRGIKPVEHPFGGPGIGAEIEVPGDDGGAARGKPVQGLVEEAIVAPLDEVAGREQAASDEHSRRWDGKHDKSDDEGHDAAGLHSVQLPH